MLVAVSCFAGAAHAQEPPNPTEAARHFDRGYLLAQQGSLEAAISGDGDRLTLTDTLPGWPELGARHRIADALGIEVALDNDVNLAAVAERAAGAGAGSDSFALLWMSEGLGVAVDDDGRVAGIIKAEEVLAVIDADRQARQGRL